MKVLTAMTARIVAAYVSNHTVAEADIPDLIRNIHQSLASLPEIAQDNPTDGLGLRPAVPIDASITPSHIICLEDGRKFKSLKRHLRETHQLSPRQYRARWGLRADYPVVAPKYSKKRARLARQAKLGTRGRNLAAPPAPNSREMPEPEAHSPEVVSDQMK